MDTRRRQKSGGSKKIDRNKEKCKLYKSGRTREINKRRKLLKHIAKHPIDKVARIAFETT